MGVFLLAIPPLVALLTAVTAQSSYSSDLQVESVEVLDPWPAWNGTQARNGTVRVVVENQGFAPAGSFTVTYRWSGSSSGYLNGDQTRSVDVVEELAPGATRTFDVPWTLQASQVGHGRVRATIDSNQPDPTLGDRNKYSDYVFIEDHQASVAILGNPRTIGPDEWRFYRVQVTNSGNVPETAALAVGGVPAGVVASFDPPTLTVPPFSTRGAPLYLHYASPDPTASFAVALPIWATTANGANLGATAPVLESVSTASSAGQSFRTTDPSPQLQFVDPGQTAATAFSVENRGSQPDTYAVTASAAPGWQATTSPSRLALFPGETALVNIEVTPASATPPGSHGWANLTTVSDHWLPPSGTNLTLRASGPAVLLSTAELTRTAYTGENATFSLNATNVGNVAAPSDSFVRWTALLPNGTEAAANNTTASMAPGATATHLFSVPLGAAGGSITIHAAWYANPTQDPGPSAIATFLVHEAGLALTPPAALSGAPGQAVGYERPPHAFRIENHGNAPETVQLTASAETGTVQLNGDTQFLLDPGAARTVPVVHLLPRPAGLADQSNLTLRAAILGREGLNATAAVATQIIDVVAPALEWDPNAATAWNVGTPYEVAVRASDDGLLEAVTVNATGPALDASGLTMSPSSEDTTLWVRVLPALQTGVHRFQVSARDAAGNVATLPDRTVDVRAYAPPAVTLATDVSAPLAPDDALNFTLADPLGIRSVRLRVYLADELVAMPPPTSWNNTNATFPVPDLPGLPLSALMEAQNGAGAWANLTFALQILAPATSSTTDLPVGTPLEEADQARGSTPASSTLLVALGLVVAAIAGRRGRQE